MKVSKLIEELSKLDPDKEILTFDNEGCGEPFVIGICKFTGTIGVLHPCLLNYTLGRYSSYYHFV